MTKTRFCVVVMCLLAIAPFVGHAQRTSTARILPLAMSQWTADDRAILGSMERGEQTIDVFKTCLRHTELCRNWMPFTRYILGSTSTLPPRDREILILRTSALSHADYDWGHHVPAAKRAGLSDEEIARIVKGPDAKGWSAFDGTLLRELRTGALSAGRHAIAWDGRDARGAVVPAGVYRLALEAGGVHDSARIVYLGP